MCKRCRTNRQSFLQCKDSCLFISIKPQPEKFLRSVLKNLELSEIIDRHKNTLFRKRRLMCKSPRYTTGHLFQLMVNTSETCLFSFIAGTPSNEGKEVNNSNFRCLAGNFFSSRARSMAVKRLVVIFATQLTSFRVFVWQYS
jgi:hypothetical protein